MSFYNKPSHSFLGLPDFNDPLPESSDSFHGGHLKSIIFEMDRSSSSVTKEYPVGIEFLDDVNTGDNVEGLGSCTESLGFESSNQKMIDDNHNVETMMKNEVSKSSLMAGSRWTRAIDRVKRQIKKFPPPLPSLNHNGQSNFFFRPVRRDGRLELTEVRIDRPEIVRVSRQNGRLQLQLIRPDSQNQDMVEAEKDHEEEEEELEEEEEEEEEITLQNPKEEEKEDLKIEGKEEQSDRQWQLPITKGDGYWRCQELISNHHYQLQRWCHHCVTST